MQQELPDHIIDWDTQGNSPGSKESYPIGLPKDDGARTHVRLERKLAFEQLIADLSSTFVNLPPDQVDREIDSGLAMLAAALGTDRANLGQIDQETGDLVVTNMWVRSGMPAFPAKIVKDMLPWLDEQLMLGKIAFAEHPADLPPEAGIERAYMESVGMKSSLVIPLRVGGKILGGLSTDSFHAHLRCDSATIGRMQHMADIFASALARKKTDEELQSAIVQIQKLKDESMETSISSELSSPWLA